jgi:hypothetical protein
MAVIVMVFVVWQFIVKDEKSELDKKISETFCGASPKEARKIYFYTENVNGTVKMSVRDFT